MQLNVKGALLACAAFAGALLLGLVLVQVGGAEPVLGFAGGGLLFLFFADLHAAFGARRQMAEMSQEMERLRSKCETLQANIDARSTR